MIKYNQLLSLINIYKHKNIDEQMKIEDDIFMYIKQNCPNNTFNSHCKLIYDQYIKMLEHKKED